MENLEWKLPLWKMKISQSQYDELKQELCDVMKSGDRQRQKALATEVALYYAEWWRREYSGNKASSEQIAESLGLTADFKDHLYELAQEGGRALDIPIITRVNRLWFRSLLMQGGLPMNHIHENQDNIVVYKRFLIGLIKHAESVHVDWNDSSFIDNLQCTNYLPASFKNEGIYELSLQIARAILEKDDELLPYDSQEGAWQNLTNELMESTGKQNSHAAPFTFKWKIYKNEDKLSLSYTIAVAKRIPQLYINEYNLGDCNSFSVYVQNQQIASYAKSLKDEFVCRNPKRKDFKWENENSISIRIKKDNYEFVEVSAPNCFAPDMENPLLLSESDYLWYFRSGTSNSGKNAILFPGGWSIDQESQEVKLGDLTLNWCNFDDEIVLRNDASGEELSFDNISTDYTCEFAGWATHWIQDSNYKVLTKVPDIRIFDGEDNRIPARNIEFRRFRQNNWLTYDEKNIPIGLLEFKVYFPDGKFIKEKFYYTGNISCMYKNMTADSGEIHWNWSHGKILPIQNQDNIDVQELGNSSWKVNRHNNANMYPGTSKFSLFPVLEDGNTPSLVVTIASPFSGVVLLSPDGQETGNSQLLCRSSLYGYRYIIMGLDSDVSFEISHSQDPNTRIKGNLQHGIYSLSRFEDEISELFLLFGSDPFNNDSRIKIQIGEIIVYVTEYNLLALKNETGNSIRIVDSHRTDIDVDYQAKLYAIPVDCLGKDIEVEEMELSDEGFSLSEESDTQKFILFSEKYSNDQVIPKYFDFSDNPYQVEGNQSGLSPQESNVLKIKSKLGLSKAHDDEWDKVLAYYRIVMAYSLPFKTLNCFRAIAQSPSLMAKMANILWMNQEVNQDDLNHGLLRFENELSAAWHWIKENDWMEATDWLFSGMGLGQVSSPSIAIRLYAKKIELMSFVLNTEAGELINIIAQEIVFESVDVPAPTNGEIQEIRAKIGANRNLPNNLVFIPDEWTQLFQGALNGGLPIPDRALLMSPVKSALAMMGHDDSIWEANKQKVRRTIIFYRQMLPNIYYELLLLMVKRITAFQQ